MPFFDDLFGRKKKSEKVNILGKEYEINPEAMIFSQQGLDKYSRQDYRGAIDAFSKAIIVLPENQNFYLMRGTSYEDMGDDLSAGKDFRKALELEPTGCVAAYRLGMVYFRKKDFETAVTWLKKSINNAPEGNLEHIGIGKNNIIFVAKKVIACNLGNFLTQLKRFEEGVKYLDIAINEDPNYPNPYLPKGLALVQMGRNTEGMKCLEKADELGVSQAKPAIQFVRQLISQNNQQQKDPDLEFVFHSSDHLRYENGVLISGPHGGAPRAVKVEGNINGGEGYTVSMFNTQGEQASVQMAPKQMKLIDLDGNKIVLKGYGHDSFGASFADYGLTIKHEEGNITGCVLHMLDRNIDIEYLP